MMGFGNRATYKNIYKGAAAAPSTRALFAVAAASLLIAGVAYLASRPENAGVDSSVPSENTRPATCLIGKDKMTLALPPVPRTPEEVNFRLHYSCWFNSGPHS
jgi:hypothetical protein